MNRPESLTYVENLGLYVGMDENGQLVSLPKGEDGQPLDTRMQRVKADAEMTLQQLEPAPLRDRIIKCLDKAITEYTNTRDNLVESRSQPDGSITDLGAAQMIADYEADMAELKAVIQLLEVRHESQRRRAGVPAASQHRRALRRQVCCARWHEPARLLRSQSHAGDSLQHG